MDIFTALGNNPIIPVLVIEKAEQAVPLAEALVEAGVTALEVTLRTSAALDAIEAIAKSVPEAIAGVGTVIHPDQFALAKNAGAKFAVSPGLTPALAEAANTTAMPYLPGVATSTEIIRAMEMGITDLKFFPASISGGVNALKAFGSVFPDVRFCPTGGIGPNDFKDYLDLKNVHAVGGSWLATSAMLRDQQWSTVTRIAKESLQQLG